MRKNSGFVWKICFTIAGALLCFGRQGMVAEAKFDAPYYNINMNGGEFEYVDGIGYQYMLEDGTVVKNAFFSDGEYTYFLQADGTPMTDRLTYHPDGEKVIYFDPYGHEVFDDFAYVRKSISGDTMNQSCYFGTYGNLYVNVITYDKEGKQLYYANPYGILVQNGSFELDDGAANYEALAEGCHYGVANLNGTVRGFYTTYEEAAAEIAKTPLMVTAEDGYSYMITGYHGDVCQHQSFWNVNKHDTYLIAASGDGTQRLQWSDEIDDCVDQYVYADKLCQQCGKIVATNVETLVSRIHQTVIVEYGVAATCTTDGHGEIYSCKCGQLYEDKRDQVTKAYGHNYHTEYAYTTTDDNGVDHIYFHSICRNCGNVEKEWEE